MVLGDTEGDQPSSTDYKGGTMECQLTAKEEGRGGVVITMVQNFMGNDQVIFIVTQTKFSTSRTDASFFRMRQSTVLLIMGPNAQNLTKAFSKDFRYLHHVFKRPQMKRSIEKHVNDQLSNSISEGNTLTARLSFDRYFYSFVICTAKCHCGITLGKYFTCEPLNRESPLKNLVIVTFTCPTTYLA